MHNPGTNVLFNQLTHLFFMILKHYKSNYFIILLSSIIFILVNQQFSILFTLFFQPVVIFYLYFRGVFFSWPKRLSFSLSIYYYCNNFPKFNEIYWHHAWFSVHGYLLFIGYRVVGSFLVSLCRGQAQLSLSVYIRV